MQRLLWASTKTKDPDASDTSTSTAWPRPSPSTRCPTTTLEAFFDHGEVGATLPADGGDADECWPASPRAGVDVAALAAKLQATGPSPSSRPGTT